MSHAPDCTLDHGHHHHDHAHHDHGKAGGHAHRHGAGAHDHTPTDFGRAFAIGITLNIAFVIAEAVFGWLGNSMALIADAGHNLSDVLGLAVAWIAAELSKRPPSARYTYGLRGSSILAALFNAVFLLLAVGAIGWEAVVRLFNPEPVASGTMIVVAGIGIVINAATAWLFFAGRHTDLNIRGAYLHMVADAAVSFGVVVAALLIMATGWQWIDPAISLCIAVVVLVSGWELARDSVNLALDAVPKGIELGEVQHYLTTLDGVVEVHDLHIWAMSTSETALTAHLVRPDGHDDAFLHQVCEELSHRFRIHHATLQVEISAETCRLAPADVV